VSTLGDKLWRDYGGDVPTDPQVVARDAIQRYGSGRAAARALGVDEAQIRRWRDGKVHNSPNVARIAQEARRSNADGRQGPIDLTIRHAKRTRRLEFGAGQGKRGLKPGAEQRIADAYVRGDRKAMADAFVAGVADPWYSRQFKAWLKAEEAGISGDAGEDSGAVGVFIA
jgi:hypothetical protein